MRSGHAQITNVHAEANGKLIHQWSTTVLARAERHDAGRGSATIQVANPSESSEANIWKAEEIGGMHSIWQHNYSIYYSHGSIMVLLIGRFSKCSSQPIH